MKHYGDITKIHGGAVEIVDIITGGSPCQDLSVAGKRAGLDGERSGLFMEQVRIEKEMREHDVRTNGRTGQFIRPRYMVWENVTGAFSSNGGKDFQAVLTEIVRIVEPQCPDVPMPENCRWAKAGCLYGVDGNWSIAWRVHDAQFWGVPQRRKRIALVADFGGLTAPEILFERKGLSRDSEQGADARQKTAGAIADRDGKTVFGIDQQGGKGTCGYGIDVCPTIAGDSHGTPHAISFQERAGCDGGGKGILIQNERTGALSTLNNQSVCITINTMVATRNTEEKRTTFGVGEDGEPQFSISAAHEHAVFVGAVCAGFKAGQSMAGGIGFEEEKAATLSANCYGTEPTVFDARGNGDGSVVPTITGDHQNRVTDYTSLALEPVVLDSNQNHASAHQDGVTNALPASAGMGGGYVPMVTGPLMASGYAKNGTQEAANDMYVVQKMYDGSDIAPTLTSSNAGGSQRMPDKDNFNAVISYVPDVAHALKGKANCQFAEDKETYITAVDCRNATENADVNGTLQANEQGQNLNSNNVCRCGSVVRRLTPKECERLQGFPDGWTDIGEWTDSKGKKHKEADTPRYKALGNSIALPFWAWLARRICAQYERPMTMASLFDGIGGFPLVFSRAGCIPVWASEIEEFPIAVTKVRFGDE